MFSEQEEHVLTTKNCTVMHQNQASVGSNLYVYYAQSRSVEFQSNV